MQRLHMYSTFFFSSFGECAMKLLRDLPSSEFEFNEMISSSESPPERLLAFLVTSNSADFSWKVHYMEYRRIDIAKRGLC